MSREVVRSLASRFGEEAVATQLVALERHGDVVDEPQLWLRLALEGEFKFRPLEEPRLCPCGSDRSTLLGRFVYWNLLGLRRCEACGLIRVSPRLTPRAMEDVFNEEYVRRDPPAFWGARRIPIFGSIVRTLRRAGARKVFDVGAAYGHFARFASQRGFVVEGCDIASEMVEWGRERWGVSLSVGRLGELEIPDRSYDAVVGLDTLYYVPDPRSELREMARILRPGGTLLLRLRTNRRLERRIHPDPDGLLRPNPLPQPHIWAFTPRTASRLAEGAGLEVIRSEPAPQSRGALFPFLEVIRRTNQLLRRLVPSSPIVTPSFHLIAKRPMEPRYRAGEGRSRSE